MEVLISSDPIEESLRNLIDKVCIDGAGEQRGYGV